MKKLFSIVAICVALFSISQVLQEKRMQSIKNTSRASIEFSKDQTVAYSPDIFNLSCLKSNDCTQEQLVSHIVNLTTEEIEAVSDKTSIWIALTIISIIVACLPISNWIYDKCKKRM